MRKNTFLKLIAIVCILTSVLLIACSCKQEPQNNQESNTTSTQATDPESTPTEPVTEPVTEPPFTGVIYKVTVVDENNAPLAGATVQLCVGNLCRLPGVTNADGIATFEYDEPDDYTVKITLAGYANEAVFYFPANSTELTVQLTAVADPQ